MGYFVGLIGMWIFSDAIYSYVLYAHSQSWRGDRQTWVRDHWVRAVRGVCGIALIVMGYLLI